MANPTGKGGFQDRPEQINRDGAPKWHDTFGTTYSRLLAMTINDLDAYEPKTAKESLCKEVILDKKDYKELADRIDGKPKQTLDVEGNMTNILTFAQAADADD